MISAGKITAAIYLPIRLTIFGQGSLLPLRFGYGQWRNQKYVLRVQYNIFALKTSLQLYFLDKIHKTP